MIKYKKITGLFMLCFMHTVLFAQNNMDNTTPDSSNFMLSNGKIYVVVAVVVTIVTGLFIYLINLDRKIKKLEKQ